MRLQPSPRWRDDRVELFVLTPELVTDAYVGWLNDVEVNRYLESRFHRQDANSVRTFVNGLLESEADLFLGIRELGLDRHVGNIRLGPIDRRHGRAEIGIIVGDKGAWGRGVGSRALDRIAAIGRHELGLRKLAASCYGSNVGSQRAFGKAGFVVEGTRHAHYLLNGQPEDAILLGKLIDESEI